MNDWKPISSYPIHPFDADRWYMDGAPHLLYTGFVQVGRYGYTSRGKGRFTSSGYGSVIKPSHWMELPEPPKD